MIHIVTRGESVYQIARYYGISQNQVISDNGLVYPYQLTPGQALFLDVNVSKEGRPLFVNGYAYPFINRDSSVDVIDNLRLWIYHGWEIDRAGG